MKVTWIKLLTFYIFVTVCHGGIISWFYDTYERGYLKLEKEGRLGVIEEKEEYQPNETDLQG